MAGIIEITDKTMLQSPYLALLAAGSTGNDGSVRGIHLRWALTGTLGKKHLPKGDYAREYHNFNKPDDYVNIYRTEYIPEKFTLDLFKEKPLLFDHDNAVWIYRVERRYFFIRFDDKEIYRETKDKIDPADNRWSSFMLFYSGSIEIESAGNLFFGATLYSALETHEPVLRTETLSVTENKVNVLKFTYSRRTYTYEEDSFEKGIHLLCENGRSIRYQGDMLFIRQIEFEFYTDFIHAVNGRKAWEQIGKYALTLEDEEAIKCLLPDDIHARWLRFNDGEFVNAKNYIERWNGEREKEDRNIKTVVERFIKLSEDEKNPAAVEKFSEEDQDGISLLDVLNLGANDFHISRMLGLGLIDTNPRDEEYFIYVAEYYTEGELENGFEPRPVQHLSLGLPTSTHDERLPIPVELSGIIPGIINEPDSGKDSRLTDNQGYTYDGNFRYVTLQALAQPEELIDKPFYYIPSKDTPGEFNYKNFSYADFTLPVYGGIEYRKNQERTFVKPELSNTPDYQNVDAGGRLSVNETVPLYISGDTNILYIHKQRESATHHYGSYGINIFSRAASASTVLSVDTRIQPVNRLTPPANINALLIRPEKPLLLSSQNEQVMYEAIQGTDKTFIRLVFDYYSAHELSVRKVEDVYSELSDDDIIANRNNDIYPDDREIYAGYVELFFRNRIPQNVSGKAVSVSNISDMLSTIQTGEYVLGSTGGEKLIPNISPSESGKYIGSVFLTGDQQFIVQSINTSNPSKPGITVYRKEQTDRITGSNPGYAVNMESPRLTADGLFMMVENMQSVQNWGTALPSKIKIGLNTWTVHRDVFYRENDKGETERFFEKSRGFWEDAHIKKENEPVGKDENDQLIYGFRGLYKVAFQTFALPATGQTNVEWNKGYVRLKRTAVFQSNGERSCFEVVRIDNSSGKLVLYFYDPEFKTSGELYPNQTVNYYPGYKVYLYADPDNNLTETAILPVDDENVHYSIFGLRALYDSVYSDISTPALMFAQKQSEPRMPKKPEGAAYATRPDTFGKSSYAFIVQFEHQPDSVVFCRSNDNALFNKLYSYFTLQYIQSSLGVLGGYNENWLSERWQDFFNFDLLEQRGYYAAFPPDENENFAFPMPDNELFIETLNDFIKDETGQSGDITQITSLDQEVLKISGKTYKVIDFVKQEVYNSFLPLTEIPVVYKHIHTESAYLPLPKKQRVRDDNGYLLSPADSNFDMAPMAKVIDENAHKVLFVDFTLDGFSKNIYFYSVREMNLQMQMSAYSPVFGPVKTVNTNPPAAPEIKRVMSVLENSVLGIAPGVQFEINAYPKEEYIRKITIYRALEPVDAVSVRSMAKVKEIDMEYAGILDDAVWVFTDEFDDLSEAPYGDPLYYRITVSRKVEYAGYPSNEVITEYAPSLQSKLLATLIVESESPEAPVMGHTSGTDASGNLTNVVLNWNKTAYKGTYYLYKMNANGNWVEIYQISTNEDTISVALASTDWGNATLPKTNADEMVIYHHFKVVAKNTAGMMSIRENILTI